MTEQPPRRRYDSTLRDRGAETTRTAIAAAARRLFLARGWTATTLRDVAREAGVSVPTVHAAYGGKAGLAMALAESADLSVGAPGMSAIATFDRDPSRQIEAMVAYDRTLFETSGDLIRLAREAGRHEEALSVVYRERRTSANAMRVSLFQAWPAGALRTGLTAVDAADIYGALCNVDVFTELVDERGWSADRVQQWWRQALERELLGR